VTAPAGSAAGVARALARLRGAPSRQALFQRATRALCEDAGFARAAAFSLRGRTLVAESVHAGDRAQPFQLGPWLRESEVLRRRRTLLVADASNDPRALGLLPGARSYVAAPVVCHESAVGLLHADGGPAGSVLTELERETLGAFAEGFGYALELAVLGERLRAQSRRVLDLAHATAATVTEPGRPGLELSAHARSGSERPPDRELDELLTRRELEVLAMLAEGDTNARIAGRLVVSEDTVKTHVKNILRKLGLHNRSQAVSRYFRPHAGLAHGPSGTRATAHGSG
jgi:DNA-binding CsgD family transcriptional regulator